MIGQNSRRIGPRFDRGNWSGPQGQLRAFLERSRTELSQFIQGSSQHPQQANAENAPQVEHA